MKNILSSTIVLCLLSSALLTSTAVKAKAPTFTYLELEYIGSGEFNINDNRRSLDLDLDGFSLNASAELGIFLLQASRFELESKKSILGSDLEDSISTIAVGLNFKLPQTAIYGLVRARRDELSVSGGLFDNQDEEADSIGIEAGVRFNLSDRFELNANIGAADLEESVSFGIGAQFHITKNLGITLDHSSLEIRDDRDRSVELDVTSVGLRLNF